MIDHLLVPVVVSRRQTDITIIVGMLAQTLTGRANIFHFNLISLYNCWAGLGSSNNISGTNSLSPVRPTYVSHRRLSEPESTGRIGRRRQRGSSDWTVTPVGGGERRGTGDSPGDRRGERDVRCWVEGKVDNKMNPPQESMQ